MANRDPQDASSSQPGHHYRQVHISDSARAHLGDTYNIGHYHAGLAMNSEPSPSPFRNKHFEVPRSPSAFFTGREDILERLQTCCLPTSSANSKRQQKRFVIHGLGGSGKSQICLKFTEDHREEFWGIFLVDASSPESLERGFLNIAEVCKQERSVNVVKRCLSNTTEPWIVILDNADDPWLDVSRYFPAGNRGIILITTRNPECKVHATVGSWELGAMTTDEAITLILKTAGVEDLSDTSIRKTAETVVATLGCLALAIIQAGAVIQKRLCSMEEYCGVYSRRRRELLSQRAVQGEDEYPYTVYTTWEVSRKMIEQMSNEVGRDALELLNVFSFFHHDGISEEIFRRSWEKMQRGMSSGWMLSHQVDIVLRQLDQEWEPYPLRVAFSLLQSFSLINRDKDNLIFIHPLVHTWARDRLSASGQETIWSQATSTVALSVPSSLHTADNQYRMFLMPHIDACLGDRIDKIFQLHNAGHDCQVIAANFGRVYGDAGRRQAAIYITERINEINLSTLGPEHEETLMSMSNLAIYYSEMGRQREALEMTESVLEVKKKNLGEEHEETLESLHSIGCEYHALGEPHKALQAFEKVVKARQRTLGEEDPSTLIAMSNLAMSYSHVGRKEDALQLTEQVVRANKEIWGEENPETLRDMRSLAHRYNEVDRQEEALQLLEQVVDAFKKTLGEEHPDTLRSMYTLASSYFDMGQTQEALELAERQTKASSRVLGQEDPKTIQSAHSLARIYAGVGQQQKSMQLMEWVTDAYKRVLGENHPETLVSMEHLAEWRKPSRPHYHIKRC